MLETAEKKVPKGWSYRATDKGDYEAFVDYTERHSGTRCATLRSIVEEPKPFGNLMQYMAADKYQGKRLRMNAWVKSNLASGTTQLWLRIDGDWKPAAKAGCFDNMDDRPIEKQTDWTEHHLVVQVPEAATGIAFGLMLIGKGQVWLDDVSFEEVDESVPLTGSFVEAAKRHPKNLDFED